MARGSPGRASAAALSAARGALMLTRGQLQRRVSHISSDPAAKFIIHLPREATALTRDNSHPKGLSKPLYGDVSKGSKQPP